jgi:hypothetical protein
MILPESHLWRTRLLAEIAESKGWKSLGHGCHGQHSLFPAASAVRHFQLSASHSSAASGPIRCRKLQRTLQPLRICQ